MEALFGFKQYGISVLYTAVYFLALRVIGLGQAYLFNSPWFHVLSLEWVNGMAMMCYWVFLFYWNASFFKRVTAFYQSDFQIVLLSYADGKGSFGWKRATAMSQFGQKYFYALLMAVPIVFTYWHIHKIFSFNMTDLSDVLMAILLWALYVTALFNYAMVRVNALMPDKVVRKKKRASD